MDKLKVLRLEYARALDDPLFDDPKLYCVLLNLIQDKIDELEAN
jgi:hypothetical protein